MKIKYSLPLLVLSLVFLTSCVDTIQRKVTQNTQLIEYKTEKQDLENKITAIVPSENVNFTTSVTRVDKDPEFNTIHLEIKNPENFPENGFSFSNHAEELKEEVRNGISNIEDFQKMEITVNRVKLEEGIEHKQTFKKEFDL